jgi:hypothetical protein
VLSVDVVRALSSEVMQSCSLLSIVNFQFRQLAYLLLCNWSIHGLIGDIQSELFMIVIGRTVCSSHIKLELIYDSASGAFF